MNVLVDEHIPRSVIAMLRQEGHVVQRVPDIAPHGTPDPEVLALAHQRAALLITEDKGFGELTMYRRRPSSGVLLLRLRGYTPDEMALIVANIMRANGDALFGALTVVTSRDTRTRRLP